MIRGQNKEITYIKILLLHLNWFWQVSAPEEVLRVDGFNRDLSCPVSISDKVGDGAEVDQSSAADPVLTGALGQIHHTGGQRQICPQ